MTDDMDTRIRAEIDAATMAELRAVTWSGEWPLHPWRARLDTSERFVTARRAVADLDDVMRGRGILPSAIAARRLEALALAWQRFGGGDEFLFHLRGEPRIAGDWRILRAHVEAPRIAINPNPGVPGAPCLAHPVSLADAARFASVQPVMRCCATLGEVVARAFDVLGQPTTAQHRRAEQQKQPSRRRSVWRIRGRARNGRSHVRMVTLGSIHVLDDIGGRAEVERLGVPVAAVHPEGWSQVETAAIGELAWRLACERDVRVKPPREHAGHRMSPNPAVIGRRYRELDDPFAPLLAIASLGCRLQAFSPDAMTFELDPPAG